MKKIIIILDSQDGHITHVITSDPALEVSVVDIDTALLDPVLGPYDPQVTVVVTDVDAAALAHIREKVPGYEPEEGAPDQSSQETFPLDSNARGRDENLAAKVLVWNGERLFYSSSFEARDPDGEERTFSEIVIADHLSHAYKEFDLFGYTRWILDFILQTIFQYRLSRPIGEMLQMVETLRDYLAAWQNDTISYYVYQ